MAGANSEGLKLIQFGYEESSPGGEKWEVEDLTFGTFNLVVGRNATGKSRLLRTIARVAMELSANAPGNGGKIKYSLRLNSEDSGAKEAWARATQFFPFTGEMKLRREAGRISAAEAFKVGCEDFGAAFHEHLLQKITACGYEISDITEVTCDVEGCKLELKETKRREKTDFRNLSQAQQRAVTFLVFLTLLELEGKPATVLVDDFAEGLDFDRARRMAQMVLKAHRDGPLQLILTSDDRNVMNVVPLENWTVLEEAGTKTRVFNYQNSKQKFDDFKFTGLTNFDFFSMDFAQESE